MLTLVANLLGFWAIAQDGGGASVNVSTSKDLYHYYERLVCLLRGCGWWGAAVFILLLVALLKDKGLARWPFTRTR